VEVSEREITPGADGILGASLSSARLVREAKRPRILVPLLLALILVGAGVVHVIQRNREARWAREEALPQIQSLFDQTKFQQALDRRVESAGTHPEAAARQQFRLLHDGVAVAITFRKSEERVKDGWGEGK